MADAQLPTPSTIFQQDYRIKDQIQPAAKTLSVYQGATPADVPNPPAHNGVEQLAGALATLQPKLNAVVGYTAEQQRAKDLAAGAAYDAELQKKNVTRIDEAVRQNLIPAGASPVFLQALREQQLANAADKRRQSLTAAYWAPENADLRASNDPAKFNEFVKNHNENFDLGVLHDAEGNKVYTDLDLHRAKYAERSREDTNALYAQHLQYRVGENEKAAEEVAGLRTSRIIQTGLESGWSHTQITEAIGAIFRDPNTGLVVHGMKPSKQTEIVVDSVVDAAVQSRDVKVLGMLDLMQTPGGSVAGTAYARKKVEAAKLHITNEVWMEGERNRVLAERRGAGVLTDPEAEARAKETRDRNEAEYALKLKQMAHQGSSLDKAVQAEPEQSAIIKHLANGASAFDPEVIGHLKNLAGIDAAAGKEMMLFVQGQQMKSKTAADEKATLNTYTRLRADLSSNPSKFDRNRIVAEANRGNLTAGQVSSLFENAEASAKAQNEYPVLKSDLIQTMRTDIRAASMKNQFDEFGEGRLRADAATNEFNDLVLDYVKKHPQAGPYEISKAMRPEVERLARRHNSELDQSLTQTETKAANDRLHAEQAVAKSQREAQFNQETDQRQALRNQLASKYPNKKQLEDVIDTILKGKK